MNACERQTLNGLRRTGRWLRVLIGVQAVVLTNHAFLCYNPKSRWWYLGLAFLAGCLAWQIRCLWTWRRKIWLYWEAVRLKDEAIRAGPGNLREHKLDQLNAVLADAQRQGSDWRLQKPEQ